MKHLTKIRQSAKIIFDGYKQHNHAFNLLTLRAKKRFEDCDWTGQHKDAVERLNLYENKLYQLAPLLAKTLGMLTYEESIWVDIKQHYARLIAFYENKDLAETFFNSITRTILMTVGINRHVEFFHHSRIDKLPSSSNEIYRTYHKYTHTRFIIKDILADLEFKIPFVDIDRDSALIAREVDLYMWPLAGAEIPFDIDVVRALFVRNKVAYIVGRISIKDTVIPFVLPLYNSRSGIFVDTVLLIESEVSIVFSFAHSYFHVEIKDHRSLVVFLKSILPKKPLAELYYTIGYSKHGKTIFYRQLHHHIHTSKKKFIIAPGKEGAVMIVFTLPDFNYVFKVIKDKPCFLRSDEMTSKTTTRDEVRYQYKFVCQRDRVGRMVDTQDFENLRFKIKRFSKNLLKEFRVAAVETVTIDYENVIFDHLFVQRKVIPLPIYLQNETDPEAVRKVIIDFGFFLKDLSATGIFPSDLFNIWNYGVTSRGRVVLFDYDDVIPLEQAYFKNKPQPRDEYEETQLEENWIMAQPNEYFMDEIDRYSGIPQPLKGIFYAVHSDLFTVEFWNDMKKRVKKGEIIDITPYDRHKKFIYQYRAYTKKNDII